MSRYPFPVPLHGKQNLHYVATCDACANTYPQKSEVCCRRDTGAEARENAIAKFRGIGWHVDGLGTTRERWFCPKCRAVPHL
jgi:hypothetical protein